jgi:hypothetical protein
VYWGDLETDEKRNLSERLSKFLFVRGGGLEVLPFADKSRFMNGVKAKQSADPQTGDGELLCDREREIEGVKVKVQFRDTLEKIVLSVNVMSPKRERESADKRRERAKDDQDKVLFTHVLVLEPRDWAFLAFSNSHWMTAEEKVRPPKSGLARSPLTLGARFARRSPSATP